MWQRSRPLANSALPEEFAAWIDETRDAATAYILDVRGNSGGSDGNAFAVLRHFAAPEDMGTRTVYKQYVDPTPGHECTRYEGLI